MPEVIPGALLECSDAATAQFLLWLEKQETIGAFLIAKLDETHLFVNARKLPDILSEMDKFSDKNAYTNESKGAASNGKGKGKGRAKGKGKA